MTVRINELIWLWFIVINAVLVVSLAESNNVLNTVNGAAGAHDELICAHVIYRHGNRSVLSPYKNDPYKDEEKWWPNGFGQLNDVSAHIFYILFSIFSNIFLFKTYYLLNFQCGKENLFRLGQFFRRRYQKLIGPKYSPDKVYVQSDSDDRTIMSALCNNFGLYPIFGDQVWNTVPIHQLPSNKTQLLKPSLKCAKLAALHAKYLLSHEIQSELKRITKLRKYLEFHSGVKCHNLPCLYKIYDAFNSETLCGLPLPEWAQPVWTYGNKTLEHFAALFFKGHTHTTEMKKISAGPLIKEIFDRFELLRNTSLENPKQKLWLYSGHDLTIVTLLNALNVYKMVTSIHSFCINSNIY